MKGNLLKISAAISFTCVIGLIVLAVVLNKPKALDNRVTISFEDELVCQKVAKDLNTECTSHDIKLTKEDIDDYKTFTINSDITSLSGLENFINLESLRLNDASNLYDYSALSKLNINSLTINGIVDLSPLNVLTSLKVLNVSDSLVMSVDELNLPNLKSLIIDNTDIFNVNRLNNGIIKISKGNLSFNTSSRQELDRVIISSGTSYKDLKVTGPCIIDSKYQLVYDRNGEGNMCTIKTPDEFITLTYNLVLN